MARLGIMTYSKSKMDQSETTYFDRLGFMSSIETAHLFHFLRSIRKLEICDDRVLEIVFNWHY